MTLRFLLGGTGFGLSFGFGCMISFFIVLIIRRGRFVCRGSGGSRDRAVIELEVRGRHHALLTPWILDEPPLVVFFIHDGYCIVLLYRQFVIARGIKVVQNGRRFFYSLLRGGGLRLGKADTLWFRVVGGGGDGAGRMGWRRKGGECGLRRAFVLRFRFRFDFGLVFRRCRLCLLVEQFKGFACGGFALLELGENGACSIRAAAMELKRFGEGGEG